MKITASNFHGQIPKYSPLLLATNYAQVASNCKLFSGQVRPLLGEQAITRLELADYTVQGLYLWTLPGGQQYWLRFADQVDVIRSPIPDDAYSRIYWSGAADGYVRYSFTPAAITGGDQYPANSYRLGIPAPENVPVASTTYVSNNSDTTTTTEERFYVFTYVDQLGVEGPPSQPSNGIIVPTDSTDVTVTNITADEASQVARLLTATRLYRTVSGSSGSATFQFVAQLPLGTTTFTDSLLDAQLAEAIQTTTWFPPRQGMLGLNYTPHGIAYGFTGKICCFSELYRPYAWPRGYELTCADDVVAMGHYESHIIAATTGRPVMFTGVDPSSLSQQELPLIEACVSKRSMVSMGYCCIYASPNGLVMAQGSGAQLVTGSLFSRDDWQALNPSSIVAFQHRGLYVFFYNTGTKQGGFIFDPQAPANGLNSTDAWFPYGSHDLSTDSLYLLDNSGNVIAWEGDTSSTMTYTYRSKVFNTTRPVQFTVCRVLARSYQNLTVNIYANGELRWTQIVTDENPFRLPRKGMALEWEIEVIGTDWLDKVDLAQSFRELREQ